MELLNTLVSAVNNVLWSYVLIVMLVGLGLWFSFRTGFVQIRHLREMVRLVAEGATAKTKKGHISTFQAFCVSTASRVGVGNIAGIAIAVVVGGPGAVFWMWVIALLGAATGFVESTLAQIYKVPRRGGGFVSSGKVTLHDDRFYLKPGTQAKLEFNLVAEGLRKIALLWQLIKNGTLEKGSVLFWDEPEANINPKYIPVLAELLIMLESEGVQIFVSTHDYFLSKYIEVKRSKESEVQYISLYKDDEEKVQCETATEFELLEHNAIMDTFRQLYREEIGVVLK